MATVEQVRLELDSTPAQAGAKGFEDALLRLVKGLESTDKKFDAIDRSTQAFKQTTALLAAELTKNRNAIGHQNAALLSLSEKLHRMERAARASARSVNESSNAAERATRVNRAAASSINASEEAYKRLQRTVVRVAGLFGAGLGIRAGVRAIAGFDLEMRKVAAVTGATGREFDQLRAKALELGAATEFTSSQVANAELMLSRAGFTAQETLASLAATLNLATVAQIGMGESADYVANAIRSFQLAAGEAVRVTTAFVAASNSANTSVPELAEAMGYVGSVAGAFNRSIEEVSASIGVLGDRGIKASRAGTALRGFLTSLSTLGPEAQKVLREAGAELDKLDPRTNNLVTIARELEKALKGGANFANVFGRYTLAGALGLAQSGDRIEELIQKMDEAGDAAGKSGGKIREGLVGAFNELRSASEAAALKAGDEGLLGALTGITRGATETVRKLAGLENETDRFGVVTDGTAAAVKALAGYMALTWAGTIIGKMRAVATAQIAVGTAAQSAAAGTAAASKAMLLTPWGAIVAGITAAYFAYDSLANYLERAASSQARLTQATKDYIAQMRGVDDALTKWRNITPTGDIRTDIRRTKGEVDALRNAMAAIAQAEGEVQFKFDTREDYQSRLAEIAEERRKAREDLDDARNTVEQWGNVFGELVASFPLAEATGQLLTATEEFENLTSAPRRIEGEIYIPADQLLRLEEAVGTIEGLREAISAAERDSGAEGVLRAVTAYELLETTLTRVQDKLEKQRAEREGRIRQSELPQFVNLEVKQIEDQIAAQERLNALLREEQAGKLEPGGAEAAFREAEERAETIRKIIESLREQGVTLDPNTDEGRAEVERINALLDAYYELERANDQLKDSRKSTGDEFGGVSSKAEQYVSELVNAAQSLGKAEDAAYAAEEVLARLSELLPEGSAEFDRLANRALEAAAAIRAYHTAQDEERSLRDAEREQQQRIDGAARLLGFLQEERDFIALTRSAVEELAIREQARQQGFSRDAEDRLAAYKRETEQLIRMRELTDSLAGGFGEFLRAVKDGSDFRDAVLAGAQSIVDSVFESSLARLQELLSTTLLEALVPDARKEPPTLGELGITNSVDRVELAVQEGARQTTNAIQDAAASLRAVLGEAASGLDSDTLPRGTEPQRAVAELDPSFGRLPLFSDAAASLEPADRPTAGDLLLQRAFDDVAASQRDTGKAVVTALEQVALDLDAWARQSSDTFRQVPPSSATAIPEPVVVPSVVQADDEIARRKLDALLAAVEMPPAEPTGTYQLRPPADLEFEPIPVDYGTIPEFTVAVPPALPQELRDAFDRLAFFLPLELETDVLGYAGPTTLDVDRTPLPVVGPPVPPKLELPDVPDAPDAGALDGSRALGDLARDVPAHLRRVAVVTQDGFAALSTRLAARPAPGDEATATRPLTVDVPPVDVVLPPLPEPAAVSPIVELPPLPPVESPLARLAPDELDVFRRLAEPRPPLEVDAPEAIPVIEPTIPPLSVTVPQLPTLLVDVPELPAIEPVEFGTPPVLPPVTVEPVDVRVPEILAPEIGPVRVEAPEFVIPDVRVPPIQVPRLDPLTVDVPFLEPLRVEVPFLEPLAVRMPEAPVLGVPELPALAPLTVDVPEVGPLTLAVPDVPELVIQAPDAQAMTLRVPELPQLPDLRADIPPLEAPELPEFVLRAPTIDPLTVAVPEFAPLDVVAPAMPPLDVEIPALPRLDVEAPTLRAPVIPPVDVRVPALPVLEVTVPEIVAPEIDVPALRAPRFDPLTVTVPQLAPLTVDVPDLRVPDVTVPPVVVPPIELPEIQAPEIEPLPPIAAPEIPPLPPVEVARVPRLSVDPQVLRALRLDIPELPSIAVDLPTLDPIPLVAPDLAPLRVDMPALEAPRIEPLRVDVPYIEPLTVSVPALPTLDVAVPTLPPLEVPAIVAPDFAPLRVEVPELPRFEPLEAPAMPALPPLEAPTLPQLTVDPASRAPLLVQTPTIDPVPVDVPPIDPVPVTVPEIPPLPPVQFAPIAVPSIPPLSVELPRLAPLEVPVPPLPVLDVDLPEFPPLGVLLPPLPRLTVDTPDIPPLAVPPLRAPDVPPLTVEAVPPLRIAPPELPVLQADPRLFRPLQIEDADLIVPPITVPPIEAPTLEAPEIRVPELTVPEIAAPEIRVPRIEAPELLVPPITVPEIVVPRIPQPELVVPPIEVPPIEAPRLEAPRIPVPEVRIPPVPVPRLEVPPVFVPPISVPPIEAPELTAPTILVPPIPTPVLEVPPIPPVRIEAPELVIPPIEPPVFEVPELKAPEFLAPEVDPMIVEIPAAALPAIQMRNGTQTAEGALSGETFAPPSIRSASAFDPADFEAALAFAGPSTDATLAASVTTPDGELAGALTKVTTAGDLRLESAVLTVRDAVTQGGATTERQAISFAQFTQQMKSLQAGSAIGAAAGVGAVAAPSIGAAPSAAAAAAAAAAAEAQRPAASSFDWGQIGQSVLTAGLTTGLSLLFSRMFSRSQQRPVEDTFNVYSPHARGGTVVYNDNSRHFFTGDVTTRAMRRSSRQTREDRASRWDR